jgi:hypothetical protein
MKKMLGEDLESVAAQIKSKILLADSSARKLELLTALEDSSFF